MRSNEHDKDFVERSRLGTCGIDVRTGAFGTSAMLVSSDFEAAATVVGAGTLTDAPTTGSVSTGTLNAAGLAAISTTGITQLRFAFAIDDDDDGSSDAMRYGSGDHADPTFRPQLVVTYQ